MPGTSPPKGISSPTGDAQSRELAAMRDAMGAMQRRLDAMMGGGGNGNGGGGDNGDGDDSGASDAAGTGEEGISYSGETNEEEQGHATEQPGGGGMSYDNPDGTRPKRMASDSAGRADRQRRRANDQTEADRIAELKSGLDYSYQACRGQLAPLSHATETKRSYLLRALRPLKEFSDDFRDVDLAKLPDEVLGGLAYTRICNDSVAVGTDPRRMAAFLPPGSGLREIKRTDRSGRTVSEFVGPVSAMLDPFRMPTARVKRFNRNPDRDY
jgi:hypothetical protein